MKFSLKPEDKKYKDSKTIINKESKDSIKNNIEFNNIESNKNEEMNIWNYIRVVNVRGEPEYQATEDEKVIIGHRDNPILGNPYIMVSKSMAELDRVINAYKIHLEKDIEIKGDIWKELDAIATEIVDKKQKIAISCWCTPKRCHTDLLIPIVVEMAKEKLRKKLNDDLNLNKFPNVDNNIINKLKI